MKVSYELCDRNLRYDLEHMIRSKCYIPLRLSRCDIAANRHIAE